MGHLHSWLADFLFCRSQRVALNGVLSSPFLSRLEFLKVAFWALFFFWFSSMISPTLGNPLYLFADDSTSAVPSVIPQTGKQQLLRSLQI